MSSSAVSTSSSQSSELQRPAAPPVQVTDRERQEHMRAIERMMRYRGQQRSLNMGRGAPAARPNARNAAGARDPSGAPARGTTRRCAGLARAKPKPKDENKEKKPRRTSQSEKQKRPGALKADGKAKTQSERGKKKTVRSGEKKPSIRQQRNVKTNPAKGQQNQGNAEAKKESATKSGRGGVSNKRSARQAKPVAKKAHANVSPHKIIIEHVFGRNGRCKLRTRRLSLTKHKLHQLVPPGKAQTPKDAPESKDKPPHVHIIKPNADAANKDSSAGKHAAKTGQPQTGKSRRRRAGGSRKRPKKPVVAQKDDSSIRSNSSVSVYLFDVKPQNVPNPVLAAQGMISVKIEGPPDVHSVSEMSTAHSPEENSSDELVV